MTWFERAAMLLFLCQERKVKMMENKNQRIEIKTGVSGMFTEIYIDGHKIEGVRSYTLKQGGDVCGPRLILDLNAFNISVDVPLLDIKHGELGDMEIYFPQDSVGEDGKEFPYHVYELSRETGIPKEKILEFINQN